MNMSELINNQRKRIDELKTLLRQLDNPVAMQDTRNKIEDAFKVVAHEEVIIAEQELLAEGIPLEKMLDLCDLHGKSLHGLLAAEEKTVPEGHPVWVLRKENQAISRQLEMIRMQIRQLQNATGTAAQELLALQQHFNNLMDIEKHYSVKENVIFPFLEKYQITGPSTVMWGKDDQIRKQLKEVAALLSSGHSVPLNNVLPVLQESLETLITAIEDMIQKEEEILLPMCTNVFTDIDWYEVLKGAQAIGFTLIDVKTSWKPADLPEETNQKAAEGRIQLPSGSFSLDELLALFSTLPVDLTFVDKDDTVRFFTEGSERIFDRSRAIIGRKVQYCHPPHSVSIVEQILHDFKSGTQNKADFWIQMGGKFIYISYFALRSQQGEYLGTLEVSQNLTYFRGLQGEKRILSYDPKDPQIRTEQKNEAPPEIVPSASTIVLQYDARADLAKGIHPAEKVINELLAMPQGAEYTLITPFPPMPLINKAADKGFAAKQIVVNQTEYHTVFTRR